MKTTKAILAAGLLAICLLCVYPPWYLHMREGYDGTGVESHLIEFGPVWNAPGRPSVQFGLAIHCQVLACEILAVVALTGALALICQPLQGHKGCEGSARD